MLERRFRPKYQKYLVDKPAVYLSRYFSPNQLTLVGGFLGVLFIPALYFGHIAASIFLLLLSGYFDSLDGTVARLTGVSDEFSCSLDVMVDRIVEASVILAFFLIHPGAALECIFMLISSGLIMWETSNIIHGGETNYIRATVSLYVSIYNLFMSLLNILMATSRD